MQILHRKDFLDNILQVHYHKQHQFRLPTCIDDNNEHEILLNFLPFQQEHRFYHSYQEHIIEKKLKKP